MLDIETRRRIDTCRDILVGKVPDPKGQVEQITIALIYKFMDDMDKQSVEMGGKAAFFAGEFAKYSWSAIFDPRIGGNEQLILYAEALTKLNENPKIPQLFRDIFKNAFLPYRDPETLRSFLKEINKFSYDHSERLGDAFEYLLSVLSSQGDAGQFRTPRHIIDFIVKVIDPKPTETILDPACGTAGFLISAYKHILKQNPKLSASQKKRLMSNFIGYDISYDMVRLSLVNMYLHSFPEPHIYEYDTLSSESRWNESADVIMANPPFMSPKGGIKPHKRFSIQAKRSEVLFVDYIAEHLNPGGRAGVIVPEGIIFQSGSAYKQLREMLMNNYLWAVVSLPAGVFNPYSGVKTSILFMDKHMSKNTDSILFVKVENDGFDLGAQRREIDKNDLPDAVNVLADYIQAVQSGKLKSFKPDQKPCNTLLVSKKKLAENSDYNLTADRYKTTERKTHQKWPMVMLRDICEINPETSDPNHLFGKNKFIYIDISSIDNATGKISIMNSILPEEAPSRARRVIKNGDVLLSTVRPNLKAFAHLEHLPERVLASTGFAVLRTKGKIDSKFLYLSILSDHTLTQMTNQMGKGAYPSINSSDVESLQIPLPPLEVQREIVAEIEGYQKIIDGARQVVDNWKPQIEINPDWPTVKFGDVCKNLDSQRRPVEKSLRKSGPYPYYGASGIVDYIDNYLFDGNFLLVSEDGANLLARSTPIAFSISGKNWVNNHAHILQFESMDTQRFCEIYINQINLDVYITGMAQPKLNQAAMNNIPIPLPPLEVQHEIVAKIETEQKAVEGCKELIALYEAKIKNVIDKVW